jgi:DNA-binding transcriptional LysR family regulator
MPLIKRQARDISLADLRAFLDVADATGFRRASRGLGSRQSALSRRVRALEETLGASLFERTRDGVRLTYAGARFLREVRALFSRLELAVRATRAAGSATQGCIRIGTVVSVSGGYLSALLRDWHDTHPNVILEFEAALPEENIARIVAKQLDVAIVTGSRTSPDYESTTLWHEDVFAALADQHPLARHDLIELSALASERFLVTRYPPGPEIYDWIISRMSGLGIRPLVEEQTVGRDTLLSLVGLGFGVTLASSAETTISYPNVSFVKVDGEHLPFSFVWLATNDNPALRRFLSDARVLSVHWPASLLRTPDPSP